MSMQPSRPRFDFLLRIPMRPVMLAAGLLILLSAALELGSVVRQELLRSAVDTTAETFRGPGSSHD